MFVLKQIHYRYYRYRYITKHPDKYISNIIHELKGVFSEVCFCRDKFNRDALIGKYSRNSNKYKLYSVQELSCVEW